MNEMPSNCSIASCKSNSHRDKSISQFRFPKDLNLQKNWLDKCNLKKPINVKNARICSLHFSPDDIKRDLSAKFLGLPPRRYLKEGVVPRFLLDENYDETSTTNLCNTPNIVQPNPNLFSNEEAIIIITENADVEMPEVNQVVEVAQLPLTIAQVPASCSNCQKLALELKKMKEKEVSKEIIALKKQIMSLKCQLRVKPKRQEKSEMEKKQIEGIFSAAQLDLLMNRKKQVRWDEGDLTNALTLRYLSKNGYTFLRDQLKYPLPGLSTLHKWATHFDMQPGLLPLILKYLSIAALNMSDEDKLVILTFDEVSVTPKYEYDPKNDETMGPHSQLQVISVKGLLSKWKTPLFAEFDTKITPPILQNIIAKLYNIGFSVLGCVDEGGERETSLWQDFGVDYINTSFKHCLTNENIYVIVDAAHLLIMIMKCFLDGSIQNGDKVVNKTLVSELVNKHSKKNAGKLSIEHLDYELAGGLNALLATQLISETTAKALTKAFPGNQVALDTAEFIEIVSNWYNVMNSHQSYKSVHRKATYELHLEEQNRSLQQMYDYASNMRSEGLHKLQDFQKDILMSITSVKELHEDLTITYKKKLTQMYRLNKESLGSLFSQLQPTAESPTPLNALRMLKTIILGKSQFRKQCKITAKEDDYIIATVLRTSKLTLGELNLSGGSTLEVENECHDVNMEHSIDEMNDIEHFAAWMVHKVKLPAFTVQGEDIEHNYFRPVLQEGSTNGLLKPSADFIKLMHTLNTEFLSMCGDGLPNKKNITKHFLSSLASKHPNVNNRILELFVKERLFMRLKYLNAQFVSREA